ncbi:hypothetical protein CA3LBN_004754 [Candidozyma haemuli]|uniref:Karyogamy protein n=1 Tax=Candidozyma haemuli TaxID=45357 RepID=A0ABX8IEF7_9ASCO|nr:hypothetical protein CA3LBN_004754 [[Candida] haemuloni]
MSPPWAKRHFDFAALIGSDLTDSKHQERGLSTFENSKAVAILLDVESYLHQIKALFDKAEDETLGWYHEERALVSTLYKEVTSIESFVAQTMALPGALDTKELSGHLKHTSDLLAKAKQALLQAQTAVSISAQYHELRFDSIKEIKREIGTCDDIYNSLRDVKLSELPNDLSMEKVVSKVKLTGSDNSIDTPIMAFSTEEREFFENFERFESRLKPISISIKFLEHRIGEFKQHCGIIFPSAIADVNQDFHSLRKSWRKVVSDFSELRSSAIVSRWRHLCMFLIDSMVTKLDEMAEKLKKSQEMGVSEVSDELGISFKMCSNANMLLHKAMVDYVGDDKGIRDRFRLEIRPKWTEVNELLSGSISIGKSPGTPRGSTPELGEDGLKPVKMIQKRTPSALSETKRLSSTNSPNNGGFDLRLDVNPSPNVPISAQKTDRFVDLDIEPGQLRSSRLQMALLGLQSSPKDEEVKLSQDDSTETLVHPKTPETHPKEAVSNYTRILQQFSQNFDPQPSKIPIIVENYIQMRFPVIKKIPAKGSRIPSISPSHPVFISPDRRPESKQLPIHLANPLLKTPHMSPTMLRSPPSFTLPKKRMSGRRASSTSSSFAGEMTPQERSRASSLTMRADKLSLAGQTTPNLAYETGSIDDVEPALDRLSLRSTSPDRPGSSIGSRFDESHLLQPIKSAKKAWK